jgi:hypothetical protein
MKNIKTKKAAILFATGLAVFGGAMTSCAKQDLDEIEKNINDTKFEINDTNISSKVPDNCGHLNINIQYPKNISDAMRIALNFVGFGHYENKNAQLIIMADKFRISDAGDVVLAIEALENFTRCLTLAKYGYSLSYKTSFDGRQWTFFDDAPSKKQLPASSQFNFSTSIRTVDVANLGYMVNSKGSLKPLVDMLQILQASGFSITGLDNFPSLKQLLESTPNPYLAIAHKSKNHAFNETFFLNSHTKQFG